MVGWLVGWVGAVQVYDVVRYRIHRSKKKIKDELEDRNTIQEYICPSATCGRRLIPCPEFGVQFEHSTFHICSFLPPYLVLFKRVWSLI